MRGEGRQVMVWYPVIGVGAILVGFLVVRSRSKTAGVEADQAKARSTNPYV